MKARLQYLIRALFGAGGTPLVRRADAHPDAPPRKPLSAFDLGPPPANRAAPVERALPSDLDQPLSAFDPAAIPAVPILPPVVPRKVVHPLAPGERIDAFELRPPVRSGANARLAQG